MDKISLISIIDLLNGSKYEIKGKRDACFSKFSSLDAADSDSITFCKYAGEKGEALIRDSKAAVILCPLGVKVSENEKQTFVLIENPRLIFAKIMSRLFGSKIIYNVHPTALIGADTHLKSVSIGANVVIGDNVSIGKKSVIYPGVIIGDNVVIGERAVIKSNAVIGEKGFGFDFDKNGQPVPLIHIGSVLIGNDVEIGANTTVVAGTLNNTIIDDFVKIDDHVHVAHNVFVGKRTIITACAEISGSTKVGDDCWLGPNCSIMNNITIGSHVLIGLGAVVLKSIPDSVVVVGNPAKILKKNE